MRLSFEPISFDRQTEYLRILALVPQLTSDYSFVNLWAWAEEYGLSWAWDNGMVWIRQSLPELCYWAPVGPWWQSAWQDQLPAFPVGTIFVRVPEQLAVKWRAAGDYTVSDARDHWDYLYSVRELIELKGNRFHKKKNLLSQFTSKFPVTFKPLDTASISQALLMQLDWCAWKNCEASAGLAAENRVISRVLNSYHAFRNILGGALLVEKQIVAFTVAEKLDQETLVIHFEKGMNGYIGVYQAMNQLFLQEHSSFKTVNREQDLGSEGLRKAKLSYNPAGFLKKYQLIKNASYIDLTRSLSND